MYQGQKYAADYLKMAGGPTRGADKKKIYVIRANGEVRNVQSQGGMWASGLESMRMQPGDAVVVPEKIASSTMKNVKDISTIISQFAFGAAAIAVLK